MGGLKDVKEPNEKTGFSIIYQRAKVQKVGSPKNELVNYIKWNVKPYHYLQCHV